MSVKGVSPKVAVSANHEKPKTKDSIARGKGNITVNQYSNKSPIEELGPISIEGRMHKPSVFYVLGRADALYTPPQPTYNFVPRILRDAQRKPF